MSQNKEKQFKIIVIGGGPAGLTAAHKLTTKGNQVLLFEAGIEVGGLSRSFDLWGQKVDCGPHRFFSSDKIVNDYFKEIIKDDYTVVNRLTRIFYQNKFFYYPLQIKNVLANLSFLTMSQILFTYILQRITPIKNPITFDEWVTNRFGKKLFTIFFKNYSEKLWGIPCSKIDADFAAQRIKKLSLWEALKGAIFGNKENKHKTLVDHFAYPNNGTGMLYDRIAEQFQMAGGELRLESPVKKVLQNPEGTVIGVELVNGQSFFADIVISTMPLTLMVKSLNNIPKEVIEACNKLYYRNTILVYLEIDSVDLFPDNWIYVHSPDVLHGRITNFRNWSAELYGDKKTTILCLEYWCFDEDTIWKQDEVEMGKLGEKELRSMKLIKSTDKVLNTHLLRIPKCYPVYEAGYTEPLGIIRNYLQTIDKLVVIGRYGSFKYNNQDHSILMGLLAARQIETNTDQDLWSINTDSEYQEKGVVEYE